MEISNFSLYIYHFLVAFLVGIFLLSILLAGASLFRKSENRLSARHIHKKGVLRFGGVAVIVSFLITLFFSNDLFLSDQIKGIMMASILILFFGLVDDFIELSWKSQLFFQISLVALIFIMGVRVHYITNPLGGIFDLNVDEFILPSLLFVIIWVVLFMNSMNWIDGIDGLSGGVTLLGAVTIFFLILKPEVNQPPVGIIAAALIGAVLAFLVFNFNPSRIMAGTSGSMFFGFILSALAIFAGTKIATALLVMTVPIVDAFWVVFERLKSGQSIFEPDKRHLHHKLLDLGWSQKKICFLYYLITITVSVIALNTRAMGKVFTILLVAAILVIALYITNRKVYSPRKV